LRQERLYSAIFSLAVDRTKLDFEAGVAQWTVDHTRDPIGEDGNGGMHADPRLRGDMQRQLGERRDLIERGRADTRAKQRPERLSVNEQARLPRS
jgi:hypothetical protein